VTDSGVFVGIAQGHADPAAAVVIDGSVVAFEEEERHTRIKHAWGSYPSNALRSCLRLADVSPRDVEAIAVGWDAESYSNGRMRAFFDDLNTRYDVDNATVSWQETVLRSFNVEALQRRHEMYWHEACSAPMPRLLTFPHHEVHAYHASMQSPFEDAVCIVADGSGDDLTTSAWLKLGSGLELVRKEVMPNSLGWFYAAITEYLGYRAYDGEYKVMGLASYGDRNNPFRNVVSHVLNVSREDHAFLLEPKFIHYGDHTFSTRFTDDLVDLIGHPPRRPNDRLQQWHADLALAAQKALEEAVVSWVDWATSKFKIPYVCLGGGVAQNIMANSAVFSHDGVSDIFVQPLCSDGGAAAGAGLIASHMHKGTHPAPLRSLALGSSTLSENVCGALTHAGLKFDRADDVTQETARILARGAVVAWFQGAMEAGPRALGQRSILADPRSTSSRDRVNELVKHRELWRPLCPSVPYDEAAKCFIKYTDSPFMTVTFEASPWLRANAPAVVHVDGTVRPQLVHEEHAPLFWSLIKKFGSQTGVPVLLNTSLNRNDEPIVRTIDEAIALFQEIGVDYLVADRYIVRKHV